jgi:hypothetical protein
VNAAFRYIDEKLGDAMHGPFVKPYQLNTLVAAYVHIASGIPSGSLKRLPERGKLASSQTILDRLAKLESALVSGEPPARYRDFVEASKSKTTRLLPREVRFKEYLRTLSA